MCVCVVYSAQNIFCQRIFWNKIHTSTHKCLCTVSNFESQTEIIFFLNSATVNYFIYHKTFFGVLRTYSFHSIITKPAISMKPTSSNHKLKGKLQSVSTTNLCMSTFSWHTFNFFLYIHQSYHVNYFCYQKINSGVKCERIQI